MKILVTGATGFLASHLIPALLGSGYEVRALVLPAENPPWPAHLGVEVCTGDVCQPETLTTAMREVDAVFHLAAMMGVRRPMHEYHAVNVTGTENVCLAALAANVKRLVHVSSTSVYRQGMGVPVDEGCQLVPLPDPYPQTKAAADKLVQRMIVDEKLPASIVRISTMFGPGDRLNFGRIADRLLAGRAIVIGSGRNRVPFAYVDDVVRGLLLVLEHHRAAGQIYNISDGNCPTQAELLQEIAGQLGARMPRFHVPYRLLYSAGFAAEGLAGLTRSPHPLVTRFGVAMYGADNRFVSSKARQELGYEPQVPLPRGVGLTAAWYRQARAAQGALSH
jgi:3beta-hydroxy-delta5-steroid dehydrogenase/steroid delta-isomerase